MASSDHESTRLSIIASLFSPNSKGSAGQTGQTYISHCRTWEENPGTGERKPRYILLAVGTTAHVYLHKSKRNTNGSFSIGKTWDIIELRMVELVDDSAFRLVIGQRSYSWFAENVVDRNQFLKLLIRSYRQYSQIPDLPELIGLPNDDYSSPAYSLPMPLSPNASMDSSLHSGPRSRPLVPLTSPKLTPPSSSNFRPSPMPQTSFRSPSPSSNPGSSRGAPSYSTPAPSVLTSYTNASTPAQISSKESSRRPPHPIQISSKAESPISSPKLSLNHSRTSAEEETRPVGSPGSPRKTARPKVSLGTLAMNSRSHSRVVTPVVETPAVNRLISSPLRPSQDRAPGTGSIELPRQLASDDKQNSAFLDPKSSRPAPAKSGPRPRLPFEEEKSLTPEVHSGTANNMKQSDERDFDVPDVLSNVEEILEAFHWRATSSFSAGEQLAYFGASESVNQIEQQLTTELKALELAEIHAIIENDERVGAIVTYLDESLAELEKMEALLSLYRTQLNIVDEDVIHIESQNRGLQVQISNQRALLEEIENIMQTIRIPDSALDALTQEPLDSQRGIDELESAAASLYKAILSVRDLNNVAAVAAASEDKVEQHKRHAQQFCKRVYEFLIVMFKYQAGLVLNDKTNARLKAELRLPSHSSMEKYLERYCGLTLFTKEIDPPRYQQLCASYFATSSELHKTEILELSSTLRMKIRKPNEDELEATFAAQLSPTVTKINPRNPLSKFDKRDKKEINSSTDSFTIGEALLKFLTQLFPHVQREQNFVIDFLHVHSGSQDNDGLITYAGYSGLEGYFKRAALNHAQKAILNSKLNDILSVMDLIFGFLPGEIKDWIEKMVAIDSMQIVGVMMALDSVLSSEKFVRNEFLTKILEIQQKKALNMFEQNVKEQLKAIETTRLTVKKRKGVVSFISTFPDFVLRVERQLSFGETPDCPTRRLVNQLYEQIIQAMFEALQTMAKSEGDPAATSGGGNQEDRDKDRLNYHTLIIENMHHFVTTVSKINVSALKVSLEKAKEQYDHNLALYIRLVLRRPLARFIDYFQGIEELLRTTESSQVSQHNQYTKSSLKRMLSSLDKKDLKKSIESLSKRVDKHFTDLVNPSAENSVVMETVWNACEKELVRLIENWQSLIEKCYGVNSQGDSASNGSSIDKNVPKLEFGTEDVKHAFLKYRPGS